MKITRIISMLLAALNRLSKLKMLLLIVVLRVMDWQFYLSLAENPSNRFLSVSDVGNMGSQHRIHALPHASRAMMHMGSGGIPPNFRNVIRDVRLGSKEAKIRDRVGFRCLAPGPGVRKHVQTDR